MPRFSDHLVKSAIRLERQSTTVPNTSNTSAFTAEISDISTPCFYSSFRDAPLGADPESRDPGSFASLTGRNTSRHLAILHETGGISDLIVENARLCIGGLRQPVHPAGACLLRLLIHGLDQRPPQPETAGAFRDKQILQITVIARRPARAVKEILHNAGELAV